MNKKTWFAALLLPLGAAVVLAVTGAGGSGRSGCPFCSSAAQNGPPEAATLAAEGGGLTLCGECGQVEGSEVCCATDAEKCPECALTAGSPGCCTIAKGADVKLCAACGQVKGGEECCAEGAETCDECNLARGSLGCCEIGGSCCSSGQ